MHEFLVEFRRGMLIARCSCGGWTAERNASSGRVAKLMEELEQEHQEHVRICGSPKGNPWGDPASFPQFPPV